MEIMHRMRDGYTKTPPPDKPIVDGSVLTGVAKDTKETEKIVAKEQALQQKQEQAAAQAAQETQKKESIKAAQRALEQSMIEEAVAKPVMSQEEQDIFIEALNREISQISDDLRFGFNDKVGQLEVVVVNVETEKVIRRFPTEEAVELMSKMKEFVGMLFDEKG